MWLENNPLFHTGLQIVVIHSLYRDILPYNSHVGTPDTSQNMITYSEYRQNSQKWIYMVTQKIVTVYPAKMTLVPVQKENECFESNILQLDKKYCILKQECDNLCMGGIIRFSKCKLLRPLLFSREYTTRLWK